MTNGLITGLQRSGTTMICHLLNKLPDSVALHEPLNPNAFKGDDAGEIVQRLESFFAAQRERIVKTGTAQSKSSNGKVPTNPFGDNMIEGRRQDLIDGSQIVVTNVHSNRFNLFIKHPAFFTAVLPVIEQHFPCYACIRNPFSVLLSWRNTNIPVSNGRLPAAEIMDTVLSQRLDATPNVIDRQLILLDYCFRQYAESKATRIIRYEDVIESQGRALVIIDPQAGVLSENLSSRNGREINHSDEMKKLADRLLESDNACWQFYSKEDVARLFLQH